MSIEEAIDTLKYLREEATTHSYISPWLVIELVDQALDQLAEPNTTGGTND